MSDRRSAHPAGEVLQAFVDAQLEPAARRGVVAHLESCSQCSLEVRGIRALMAALEDAEPCPEAYSAARSVVIDAVSEAGYRGVMQQVLGSQVATRPSKERLELQMAAFLGLRAASRCRERFARATA
jgi:anti-sigma factor RsiW